MSRMTTVLPPDPSPQKTPPTRDAAPSGLRAIEPSAPTDGDAAAPPGATLIGVGWTMKASRLILAINAPIGLVLRLSKASKPQRPTKEIRGNKSPTATPICAVAEAS